MYPPTVGLACQHYGLTSADPVTAWGQGSGRGPSPGRGSVFPLALLAGTLEGLPGRALKFNVCFDFCSGRPSPCAESELRQCLARDLGLSPPNRAPSIFGTGVGPGGISACFVSPLSTHHLLPSPLQTPLSQSSQVQTALLLIQVNE